MTNADRRTDGRSDGRGDGSRPKTRAEERAEQIKTPTRSELLERAQALERELAAAREQAEDNLRKWQRSAADFSNYRRRTEEERGAAALMSNALLITKLLAVLDDFDRALDAVPPEVHDAWVEGVRLVERKLRGVLDGEGVTPIDALGRPFDPHLHEAVVHEETREYPDNQVIGELQRGYRLHDRVIRPALVRVAKNPAGGGEGQPAAAAAESEER
ncbi:MAG TPA: nucleotide exchange factor GrpE [Candidatus Limnocylindria bacterium]|jgi:molecular chaperone GrpE|nr:nucleotide exchange factor GrpE [Candidatus Limnocylindria bacterium]